jgi:hypothetical protein
MEESIADFVPQVQGNGLVQKRGCFARSVEWRKTLASYAGFGREGGEGRRSAGSD